MARLEKAVYLLSKWLNWIAGTALVAAIILVCANVFGRAAFGMPIIGTIDIASYLGALILAWALAYTQLQKGNISIDILMRRLPQRVQIIVDTLILLISLGLFVVISWQSTRYAILSWTLHERSLVIKISSTPFISVVASGCIALSVVLLTDFLKSLLRAVKK